MADRVRVRSTTDQVAVTEATSPTRVTVTGAVGATGPAGADGADGLGIPAGGLEDQVLAKASDADNDTEWISLADPGAASVTAAEVGVTPAGDLSSDNVQNALEELDSEKAASSHTHTESDITDLDHSVGAVSNVAQDRVLGRVTAGSGDSEELTAAQVRTLINVEDGATADQDASEVAFTPAGDVAASDVQAAIEELDSEKAASSHTHVEADITDLDHSVDAVSNVAQDRIVGRVTAGSGDSEELTAAQVRTLINVEDGATADQSGAEIKAAYEAEDDTNAYTDLEKTKLAGVEDGATADQDASDIRGLGFFDTTNDGSGSGLDADLLDGNEATAFAASSHTHTESDITDLDHAVDVVSNVAQDRLVGRVSAGAGDSEELTASQARTLLNVEDGATADQTGAEIKAAYEAEDDTNAYTDLEKTKLAGIEDGATADQDASEVAFTPAGDIAASDVQAAIEELDSEKAASSHTHTESDITDLDHSVDVVSNVAQDRIVGRVTAGSGDSEELTAAQVRTLINVEDGADVTDTANVTAAGALMDSELTDLAGVKALDTSTIQTQPSEGAFVDGDKTKLDGIESGATADQDASDIRSLGFFDTSNDGSGSGLDADLLDGNEATAFATASHSHSRSVQMAVTDPGTALTTGDGKGYFVVPPELNGYNLTDADAAVVGAQSSSGTVDVMIHNATDTVDMLSTGITIDANEDTSYTAATPPVVDTSNDDVATGDVLRFDVDSAGTGSQGLVVMLVFEAP
jgi:hypothetical protein